ncbi:hypothetical protein MHM95_07730 [Pseudoalteromonas sp. CnMc7-15]|uniref:hypothetical protein n=1 Tax=unclassified Pseudoalteromonas TaxID=194690 RepID=UPI001EF670B1|nr:hypothetical protein [Pseudoalteromonas sp. CnMc7-15]MCG7566175.1 hypothetical protein [Pseudoalteromonas sp. CnMc7-15]
MKFYSCLLFLLAASTTWAGEAPNARIERVMLDTSLGNKLFIKAVSSSQTNTSCQQNAVWNFVLPLNTSSVNEAMVSYILTAHATNTQVTLIGADNCSTFSAIETLKRIEIN